MAIKYGKCGSGPPEYMVALLSKWISTVQNKHVAAKLFFARRNGMQECHVPGSQMADSEVITENVQL